MSFLGEVESLCKPASQDAVKGGGINPAGQLLSVNNILYVITYCNRKWKFHCSELPIGAEIDRNHCQWHNLTEHDVINIYDGGDHSNQPSWVGMIQGYVFVGVKSTW